MSFSEKSSPITHRIIIHGGAGNITRSNLPRPSRKLYRQTMLDVLTHSYDMLRLPSANALDVATFAVTLLENNPLFNAGKGAVYTTAGTHELEASVMVSRGYKKRGVGVMGVRRAKNPIRLAREMLLRGELEGGGGAQGHVQLHGDTCDRFVEQWGLERVKPSYFWTRKRWDEHRRGLGKECDDETYERHRRRADEGHGSAELPRKVTSEHVATEDIEAATIGETSWDGHEYLPQGTVGAVVLDSTGILCVATSTGGLTNKLPGRIGDTPTFGAGFWAEEWTDTHAVPIPQPQFQTPIFDLAALVSDCLPGLSGYMTLPTPIFSSKTSTKKIMRAVAMSGTGNGDSFLRLAAARTAAAMARFSASTSLQSAVTSVAGPGGMLQQSAEDRWHKTGEGEGGLIGIELVGGKGEVVFDFNCGGMFHAWIDDKDRPRFQVFHDG